jgi:hypothetical protein
MQQFWQLSLCWQMYNPRSFRDLHALYCPEEPVANLIFTVGQELRQRVLAVCSSAVFWDIVHCV